MNIIDSNFTLAHQLNRGPLLSLYSHRRVFNNENNSYTKISVKQPLVCSRVVLNTTHLDIFDVIWCIEFIFPDAGYKQENNICVT